MDEDTLREGIADRLRAVIPAEVWTDWEAGYVSALTKALRIVERQE